MNEHDASGYSLYQGLRIFLKLNDLNFIVCVILQHLNSRHEWFLKSYSFNIGPQ